MTLAAIEAALAAGDDDEALVHALAVWQSCRHPRIAAVIETISARATRGRQPPKSTGSVEIKQNAWLALAADRDPSDIDNLLATFGNVKDVALLVARLATLEGRADPRIAKGMHALLEDPPIKTTSGLQLLITAMELIVEIADPRSDEAWSRLVRRIGDRGGAAAIAALRPRMPSASTRLHAAIEAVSTELTDEARLASIEDQLIPPRAAETEALFAAVYANPDDDRVRIVLADLLQELGDPRGELIALQLAPRRTPRERQLLAMHGHEWLGEIAPLVSKTELGYARGFVDRCNLIYDRKLVGLVELPEWRTVTDLDVSAWRGEYGPLLANIPTLRRLRGVANPIALPAHARIEHVQTGVVSQVDELMPLVGFPALRSLHLDGCWRDFDTFDAFWRSPVIPRLTELSVASRYRWMPSLLDLGIRRIGLMPQHDPWHLWFEGGVVTVEAAGTGWPQPPTELFAFVEARGLRVRLSQEVASSPAIRRAFAGFPLSE